ncbi:MAG: helix-turn-helix transcriptional regulator [Hyphomicrobiales bacterium]|nr:helix-turn-helix transcriptional regulator [Hyphomicrobiales bacterium]
MKADMFYQFGVMKTEPSTDADNSPGAFLRKMRKGLKLSQFELAELAHTSSQQISRLEQDERSWTLDWAKRLAPHLKISPVELLFPGMFSEMDKEFFDVMSSLKSEERKKAIDILNAFVGQQHKSHLDS